MNNLWFEISFIYFLYDIIFQYAPSRPQLCGLTIQAYERNRFRCIERDQVFLIHCTVDQMQSQYFDFHSIPRVLHRNG